MHFRIILIFFFQCSSIYLSSSSDANKCDQGEELFEGYCYEFVNASQPLSYTAALDFCQSRGKSLVKITNPRVQSFLANSAELRAWSNALIGLRLLRNKWSWARDGSLLSGQGCFIDNTEKRDLNISTQFMYSMVPQDCIDYCRTQPTVRFAGVQDGRQCFCGSDFGDLPPTTNCHTPCGGDGSQYCGGIGANYIYAINGVSSTWEPGMPTNKGGCAAMVIGRGSLFPWRDVPCSTKMAHVCQFDNYREFNGVAAYFCLYTTCYAVYDLKQPWYAARRHCQQLGGDLVQIESKKIHTELVTTLSDFLYLNQVWIGASNGRWNWADGSAVDFDSWATYSNQPIVSSISATCTELSSSETNYNWVTRDCNGLPGRSTLVCERQSSANGVVATARHASDKAVPAETVAVISDPQAQSSHNGASSTYGVAWYGWLLIGIAIGLVCCAIAIASVWVICKKADIGNRKRVSSAASSAPAIPEIKSGHVCRRHREDAVSSGIGSSIVSTVVNSQNNSEQTKPYSRNCCHHSKKDVITVKVSDSTKMLVNTGHNSSTPRQPVSSMSEANDNVGRRRSRTRIGPTPITSSVDSSPRDPFSVDSELV